MAQDREPHPPGEVIAQATDGAPLEVRLEPELLEALDRYGRERGTEASRSDSLRSALREWALSRGYLPSVPDEGKRPAELDASNDD
jgi:hypothetical protein